MATEKTCLNCGKNFLARQSRVKTCSRACGYAFCKTRSMQRRQRTCSNCGKTYLCDHPNRETKACSVACVAALSRRRAFLTCEYCGELCERKQSDAAAFRFCSRACKARALTVGKWIGVRADKRVSIPKPYERPYYRRQASRARRRDNYTCRSCGHQFQKGSRSLDVHHKVPIRLGGSDHLNNLVSLCRSCHSKADYEIRLTGASCPICNKALQSTNTSGYCSAHYEFSPQRRAASKARSEARKTGPRRIVGKTLYHCRACGVPFWRQRGLVKVESPFCGRKCYQDVRCRRVTPMF